MRISAALLFLVASLAEAAAFSHSFIQPNNPSSQIYSGVAPRIVHEKNHRVMRTSLSMKSIQKDALVSKAKNVAISAFAAASVAAAVAFSPVTTTAAFADSGAETAANAKITTGGASTLQSGRTIAITRGVNLDGSNFGGQNLRGVAFQQSIVRDANFKGSNLVGASFFDATVDGSDFEGADMSLANVEMAQFNRANLKNVVAREMYVSGATLFTGVKDIEGSDWTDTMLRKDQQKYLCNHPTAKGTNPSTGVDTRESLMCID
uniref:Pentapeptide repeat protein n=1 Tax=Pseudictyota dubia TaxID=2749911 RepID=A0A7R9W9U9_9STRA